MGYNFAQFNTADNIMASNKGRAYFMLGGYHFNPDDITKIIGLEPTKTDASGASSGLDKPKTSTWEISTETVEGDVDVYLLTDEIRKLVEPKKEEIKAVCESHNLSPRISIVLELSIDKDETEPDVGFGARTINFLAEIGGFMNVEYKLANRV